MNKTKIRQAFWPQPKIQRPPPQARSTPRDHGANGIHTATAASPRTPPTRPTTDREAPLTPDAQWPAPELPIAASAQVVSSSEGGRQKQLLMHHRREQIDPSSHCTDSIDAADAYRFRGEGAKASASSTPATRLIEAAGTWRNV